MAFRYADPEQLAGALARANKRMSDEAPTVATAAGVSQRDLDPSTEDQGPKGSFAAAANDPEAIGYFNDFGDRLDYFQTRVGNTPPPLPPEGAGIRPEEEEALA